MLSKFRKFILPENEIIKHITDNSKILDIGCGINGLSKKINLQKIISYTGIDINIKKNINSEKIKIFNSGWNNIINNIKNFDTILIIDVLHHIDVNNQKLLIETTINNMKKNSTLIYKDISNTNSFYALMNKLHDLIYNFQIINYYESANIINMLNKNRNYVYTHFKKRIFWYDHEFIIIKKL